MGTGQTPAGPWVASVSEEQSLSGDAAEESIARAVSGAMEAAGIAAYCWTLAGDALLWSPNAAGLLGAAPEAIRSGRRYASLIDPASGTTRFDAVMAGGADGGDSPPFIKWHFGPLVRS